jgi:hypothetical protein
MTVVKDTAYLKVTSERVEPNRGAKEKENGR